MTAEQQPTDLSLDEMIERRDWLEGQRDDLRNRILHIQNQLATRKAHSIESGEVFDEAWAHRAGAAMRHIQLNEQRVNRNINACDHDIKRLQKERAQQHRDQRADSNRAVKHQRATQLERCFVDAAKRLLPEATFDGIMLVATQLLQDRQEGGGQ